MRTGTWARSAAVLTGYAVSSFLAVACGGKIAGQSSREAVPTGRPAPVLLVSSQETPVLLWPLPGRINSGFGEVRGQNRHAGIDIDGRLGQRVKAAAAGKVIRAQKSAGYGLFVEIDHGGGWTTIYAHTLRSLVLVGDRVRPGDSIAKVGRSGNARGTHLHFEVRRNGRPVDPIPLLPSDEVTRGSAAPQRWQSPDAPGR